MRIHLVLTAAFALCAVSLAGAPAGGLAPLQRSFSNSRHFVVYGADQRLRGAIAETAEREKTNLLHLLRARDEWQIPIVVNLQYREANAPETAATQLNVSQTGFGLKLQLDLVVTANLDRHAVERELLGAIVTEMMYRGEPAVPAGLPLVRPPEWLLEGCLLAAPERQNDRPADLLHRLASTGKLAPIVDFVRTRPELLDTPSRAVYAAHAFALVQLLIDQPDGASRLARFVDDLAAGSGDVYDELKTHFPLFAGSDDQVEEAWTLAVARIASGTRFHALNIAETEQELDRSLAVTVGNGNAAKTYRIDDFAQFIKSRPARAALNVSSEQLQSLGTRANPVYQPVIDEYRAIAAQLARGKTRGIETRLARVKSYRETVASRMREIDDYMNWFEATQSQTQSGAFDDYLRAADLSQQRERPRRDAISVYIDSLEAQLQPAR